MGMTTRIGSNADLFRYTKEEKQSGIYRTAEALYTAELL